MYLDPGFGGMLLQIIVAIVAVSGGILFSLRKKIRNLFSKKHSDDTLHSPQIQVDIGEDDVVDVLKD